MPVIFLSISYLCSFQYEIVGIQNPSPSPSIVLTEAKLHAKKERYVPVSKQHLMLPPLPSANQDSNMARCRYYCGYECHQKLILTHQQGCGGRPRYEMEYMPGMKFTYTCNICHRSCGRMFDMLKHFQFGMCLPELPPFLANKRKRAWPISLVKTCYNCDTVCSTKYNVDRHFSRKAACEKWQNELIAENNSAEVKAQIDIEEMIDLDPMVNQPVHDLLSTPPRIRSKRKPACHRVVWYVLTQYFSLFSYRFVL